MRIMFRSFYLVVVVVVTALAAVSVTANNSGIVDNVVDNVVDITVDIVDTIIPIIDHVSDDEYPMIKRPIQTGTIKLTDSTHTSSSSSSSSRLSKIKYTINSKQKSGSDENISNDNEIDNENENENKNRKLQAPGSPGTNLWSMDDPTVDYSENEFDGTNRLRLGYTTSNIIEEAMFTSTWWTTDCKAGGNAIETEGAGYRFIYTSANITNTNNTDGSSSSTGTLLLRCYYFVITLLLRCYCVHLIYLYSMHV
jgi:hypothetical protein